MRLLALASLAYAAGSGCLYLLGRYPRHRAESAWIVFAIVFAVLHLARLRLTETAAPEAVAPRRLVLPAFLAAACLLYLPSFGAGRFADDFVLLSAAARWDLTPAGWEHLRPLPLAVWALLGSIGLGNALILHALNIALHGLNAALVGRLALAAGLRDRDALFAGALFLVFGGAVETVTWISGLQDVLMTACVLGFLLAALAARPALALALLIAATLSKETAVCAPVLLLMLRAVRPVRARLMLAAFGWTALFAAVRLSMGPDGALAAPASRYVVKELFARPFGGLAMPWTGGQIAAWPLLAIAGVAALAALIAVATARRFPDIGSRRPLIFGAWCLVAVAPVYLHLYIGPQLQGSRYLYLPAAGWCLFIVTLARAARPQAIAGIALTILLAAGLASSIVQQLRWRSAAAFRDQVLQEARDAAVAYQCRAPLFLSGPEALDGAYVFVNGLNEAFREGRTAPADPAPDCRLAWRDGAFVKEP